MVVGAKVENERGELIGSVGWVLNQNNETVFISSDGQAESPVNRFTELFGYEDVLVYKEDGEFHTTGKAIIYSSTALAFQRVQLGFILLIVNAIIKTFALWIIFLLIGRRLLTRPLQTLTSAANELDMDDLENIHVDINSKSRTELKILEIAFNAMIQKIQQYNTRKKLAEEKLFIAYQEVETKVTQRTLDLKESNEQLKIAKDEANKMTQAKSEFLANMSHEIRTPMNGVIVAADLALALELTPKTEKYLKIIHNSGYSLLGIINDILDFSKIEAGKLEIATSQPFRLDKLIQKITDLFINKAQEKNIELLVDIEPSTPMALLGDPLRIQQIITNLLGNAIKFTPAHGHILIGVTDLKKSLDTLSLRLFVKDTGVGIKPEYLQNLFEPFTQADASTTRKYGGTGLGLTISKQLIEMMGGEIWAESEYGKGTTFFFTITLARQPADQDQKISVPKDIAGLNVLAIDDSKIMRDILKKILLSYGYQVTLASSGKEAIIKLKDNPTPFNLVIIDWRLPDMDGFEVAEKIRRDLNFSFPIIMLTAFGKEAEKLFTRKTRIDGFLTKPIQASSLFDVIMDVFGKELLVNKRSC